MRTFTIRIAPVLLWCAACVQRPTLTLHSLTPRPGTSVTPESTLAATVEYRINEVQSQEWFLIIVYESVNRERRTVSEGPDPRVSIISSTGVMRIEQPFRIAWADAQIARPFTVWIYLNKDRGNGRSKPLATLGPFIYEPAARSP